MIRTILFFLVFNVAFIQNSFCFFNKLPVEVGDTVKRVLTKWENKELDLGGECAEQLYQVVENLLSFDDGAWAFKMIDATGKFPSGLLEGNMVVMGSFDECLKIKSDQKNLTGNYCIVTIDLSGLTSSISSVDTELHNNILPRYKELTAVQGGDATSQIGVGSMPLFGICIPNKCTQNDLKNALHSVTEIIPLSVKCQTKDEILPALDTGAIVTMSVFAVVIILMIFSTLIDYICRCKEIKPHPLTISFSIYTNGENLFRMRSGQGELSCIHGIRFLSMCWVIFGHINITNLLGPSINMIEILKFLGETKSMLYLNVVHAVDTFFVLSGLLVSYNFMKKRKKGEEFTIFTYFLHRYLRLTPAYAVVILCTLYILQYLGTGPVYYCMDTLTTQSCKDEWWKALLYVQNYFSKNASLCISQTWNLSVDYQLYLISPILLFFLYKTPKFGTIFTILPIIGCMIAGYVVTQQEHCSALLGGRNTQKFLTEYYFKTHTRAPTWLIGILLGYVLAKIKFYNDRRFLKIPKILVFLIWLVVLAVIPVCIYGFHDELHNLDYDLTAHSLYNTFVRPIWALCISWIIFACTIGYGGIINDLLSFPIFGVLSKFTYCMYLLHLTILYIILLSRKTPGYFSQMETIYQFCSLFAITFIISIFWILAFEMPILVIEPYIFGKSPKTSKRNQQINNTSSNNENMSGTYRNELYLKVRDGQPTSDSQTRF